MKLSDSYEICNNYTGILCVCQRNSLDFVPFFGRIVVLFTDDLDSLKARKKIFYE